MQMITQITKLGSSILLFIQLYYFVNFPRQLYNTDIPGFSNILFSFDQQQQYRYGKNIESGTQ